jgi:hypothetical protein
MGAHAMIEPMTNWKIFVQLIVEFAVIYVCLRYVAVRMWRDTRRLLRGSNKGG